jgi:transketolase
MYVNGLKISLIINNMRKEFANYLFNEMKINSKIVLITADIGYGILDKLRNEFPDRILNVGSSEMLMIGIAVGLSYDGYIPICYTISSFLLYRPFEMIRNYVNYECLNIKLVGSGRDKDYIHDGITHWMEDDVKIITNCFNNIHIYKPDIFTEDTFRDFINCSAPCYLNLKRNV